MAILIAILAVVVILAMAGTFYLMNGTRTRGNSLEARSKRTPRRESIAAHERRAPGLN